MSQRQAAKVLGVGLGTVQRDLNQNGSKGDPKRVTGSAKTKAHRAATAAQSVGRRAPLPRQDGREPAPGCRTPAAPQSPPVAFPTPRAGHIPGPTRGPHRPGYHRRIFSYD
jgi:hypothetical protein